MEMVRLLTFLAFSAPLLAADPKGHAHGKKGGHGPAGSGTIALDVFGTENALDLLVVEKNGESTLLLHQRSENRGHTWSNPVLVAPNGPPVYGARRGCDPQIAAAGNQLVAVWTMAGTDAWGSGPLATATSKDGGKTWTPGPNPADDGATNGHGFADLAVDDKGVFHLVWLDSRDGKQGLRYSKSADAGATWSSNLTLKPGTCECCPNTLASGAGKIGVLYRAQDPRDMRVAVSEDYGKSWPAHDWAGSFNWKLDGCPHAGGGLAIAGNRINAVVWTGEPTKVGVYALTSKDSGKTWETPERLGPPEAVYPDIAVSGQRLAAVWGVSGAIWSSSSENGGAWSAPTKLSGETAAAYPRVIAAGDGFSVFWTEGAGGDRNVWKSRSLPQ